MYAMEHEISKTKTEESKGRYIHVSGRTQGDFLLLEVENSFRGNTLFQKGTGLSNIKAVAEKYHGAMRTTAQGKTFLLSVLLIIPRQSDDILHQNSSDAALDSRNSK